MNFSLVSSVLFLLLVLLSRYVSDRGLKTLTPEEKVRLVDGFSSLRIWNLLPFVLLFISYLVLTRIAVVEYAVVTVVFLGLVVVSAVAVQYATLRKIRSLGMPDSYRRWYIRGRLIYVAALIILFGWAFSVFWSYRVRF